MSVVVFDADDTLWMNEWQYSQAYAEFFAYLYGAATWRTPNLHYVHRRFFEIDGGLFATWGIRRGRVAEAMVLTYREVCAWIVWRFGEDIRSDEHERAIRAIGDLPFDYEKLRWLSDAQETLHYLQSKGHTLCLLTSYDAEIFPSKSAHLSLSRFFKPERVRVLSVKKTPEDFVAVSGDDPEQFHFAIDRYFAVGNGESDILPAVNIGKWWRGVCIPHGSTSKYLEEKGAPGNHAPPPLSYFMPPAIEHPRVTTAYRIGELRDAIW